MDVPDGIAKHFANRGYYGSVSHNVKATYVFYLGWFDANPANLHKLPPADSATKYGSVGRSSQERSIDVGRRPADRGRFAAVNDSEGLVAVVVADDLLTHERLNFHPLVNHRTTAIKPPDLIRFLEASGHVPLIRVDLGWEPIKSVVLGGR